MALRSLTKFIYNKIRNNVLRPNLLNTRYFSNTVSLTSAPTTYEYIKTENVGINKNIGLITLNRPNALNILTKDFIDAIESTVEAFDANKSIDVIVLTGSEKAFAAGANVKEMLDRNYADMITGNFLATKRLNDISKPLIAAVNGLALGGGCELAMMCDIIYAGEKAKFGQPEVLIGTIPGAGGTQRLPRYVGKSKAMEIVLTGELINAREAEKMGLVSKIYPPDQLVTETIKLAEKIAKNSPLITRLCKESINTAFEMTLRQGLHFEKRIFHDTTKGAPKLTPE